MHLLSYIYILFCHTSKLDPQIAATNTCATNKRNTWHKTGFSDVHDKRLVSATGAPSLGSTVFTAVLGALSLAATKNATLEWRNNGGHVDVFKEGQRKWHKSKVIYCSWNGGATFRSTNIAGGEKSNICRCVSYYQKTKNVPTLSLSRFCSSICIVKEAPRELHLLLWW